MAIVLSLQENIDLLLLLVKLAIALGSIAIALSLMFWLRLKKIENRLYQRRRQLKPRFNQNITQKTSQKIFPKPHKSFCSTKVINRSMGNLAAINKRSPKTQVYITTSSPKLLQKSKRRSSRVRLHWLWAIMIASMTGMAIALMQLGNSFISPEYMPIVWLLIGVTLVMSATFIEIA
ncbi:hypothetical protein APA_1519 [Pseudanabaena sp. lw0831]|uniref:hypothetical protein n=1 Tax=Pseudanabaena sp. lw0831 TaxID=1357935 RepID=UPI001915DE5C|nr:hypothetical protein [Pseudanabaena sp. lw0831]GBO53612.1 hypothetical protein APA_1519 [Pseudanabaena sp. lw0831]